MTSGRETIEKGVWKTNAREQFHIHCIWPVYGALLRLQHLCNDTVTVTELLIKGSNFQV